MKAVLEKLHAYAEAAESLTERKSRLELRLRAKAWWAGEEFDPEELKKILAKEEEERLAGAPAKVRAMADDKQLRKPPPRIAALEAIWGRGRWLPSSGEIDGRLLEAMGRQRGRIGKLGVIGIDATAADLIAASIGEELVISEWRMPCARRTAQIVDNAVVKFSDLDRLNCFEDGTLKALASSEILSFADHKTGLAARAYRALRDGGRWAFMEYAAMPGFTPLASFASAWAEPQLMLEKDIRGTLETAGFRNVRSTDITQEQISATRSAFARLGPALEDATAEAIKNGRDGALMLQELSWEAAAWKARLKALEAGGLRVLVWSADKPGADVLEEESQSFVSSLPVDEAPPPAADPIDPSEELDAADEGDWNITEGSLDMDTGAVNLDTEPDWDNADDLDAAIAAAAADEDEGEPLGQDDIDSLFD